MRAVQLIFIIAFLLTTQKTIGQAKNDSLKSLIKREHVASKKADLLFKLAQTYRRKHSDSSLHFAQQSLDISKNNSYNLGIANASIAMAWAFYTKSNDDKAHEFALLAIKHYEKCGNQKIKIGACYRLLAAIYTKEKK